MEKSASTRIMNNNKLQNEKRPGVCNIKQVNLYQMWKKFLPERFRDAIFPKPSDKILNFVKAEMKGKLDISKYN